MKNVHGVDFELRDLSADQVAQLPGLFALADPGWFIFYPTFPEGEDQWQGGFPTREMAMDVAAAGDGSGEDLTAGAGPE